MEIALIEKFVFLNKDNKDNKDNKELKMALYYNWNENGKFYGKKYRNS